MNTLLLQTKRDKIKDKEREPTLNSKIDSTNVDFSFQQRYIHFKTEPPTAEVKDLFCHYAKVWRDTMRDASDLHFTQTWLILLCDLHYLTHLERYYAHVQTPLQLSLVALYIAPHPKSNSE